MTVEQFIAIVGALTALIVAVGGLFVSVQRWHSQVNGRMDQLLLLTATAAHAEGVKQEADTKKVTLALDIDVPHPSSQPLP